MLLCYVYVFSQQSLRYETIEHVLNCENIIHILPCFITFLQWAIPTPFFISTATLSLSVVLSVTQVDYRILRPIVILFPK